MIDLFSVFIIDKEKLNRYIYIYIQGCGDVSIKQTPTPTIWKLQTPAQTPTPTKMTKQTPAPARTPPKIKKWTPAPTPP